MLWALPRPAARAIGHGLHRARPLTAAWRALSSPLSAWLLFTVALWGWHAPALYEAALEHEGVHALEHGIFVATAMLFWWVLFRKTRDSHVRYGIAVIYLFTTVLQSGVLGALMTFSLKPWYPFYAPLAAPWGLTPLEDQQLAGLIMWIPGGAVYTLLTIRYFAAWLRALDQRSVQVDRLREETREGPPEANRT